MHHHCTVFHTGGCLPKGLQNAKQSRDYRHPQNPPIRHRSSSRRKNKGTTVAKPSVSKRSDHNELDGRSVIIYVTLFPLLG